MTRPPQVSRSFPLLTLLMAIPLVAILGYIAYARYVADDAPGDGWKTYRNERFKYEIRYPASWVVERESGGDLQPGVPTHWISFIDPTVPTPDFAQPRSMTSPPLVYPARLVAWVNPQGDWCTTTLKVERQPVIVNGVNGQKIFCYPSAHDAETCNPLPFCAKEAWSIMLDLTRNDTKFWIFVESYPVKDPGTAAMLQKVIDSFRFVD
jgi:hypothetical protein